MDTASTPVVMVHGWGGSFATTWEQGGLPALLEESGRTVVGVDLLGHGTAPKPVETEAYAELGARVLDAIADVDAPVDAVGFSLGALTLLRLACAHPERFQRLVLAGIGKNVFDRESSGTEALVAGLDHLAAGGDAAELTTQVRHFVDYAHQPGNDPAALRALMAHRNDPIEPAALAAIEAETVVVVGDRDFVHPADELVAALPNARSVTLRNVDHFATPSAFGLFDVVLETLAAP